MVKAIKVKGPHWSRLRRIKGPDKVAKDAHREASEAVRAHLKAFNPIKGLVEALAEGRV